MQSRKRGKSQGPMTHERRDEMAADAKSYEALRMEKIKKAN